MAKYKIAWMPGDGIGQEVMEAARIVLDKLQLDAEYLPADIGWECTGSLKNWGVPRKPVSLAVILKPTPLMQP